MIHVTGYTFRQAVAYLNHEGSGDLAVAAAAQHGARQGCKIVERGERAPFAPPPRDDGRWPGVRAYLVEQRAIPARIVDELHRRGTVYADHRANAVFIRQDAEGNAVGASLRGTLPGSAFQGLDPGTQREAGHFSYTIGQLRPYEVPQYVIVESSIDAMSAHALKVLPWTIDQRVSIEVGRGQPLARTPSRLWRMNEEERDADDTHKHDDTHDRRRLGGSRAPALAARRGRDGRHAAQLAQHLSTPR